MSGYFKQNLKEEEEPLMLLKQYWATFLLPLLRTVVLLAVTIPFANLAFSYMWATWLLLGWWCFVIIWGIISWFTWYFNITLVTSLRVVNITQKGIFSRRVREVSHQKISEVTFEIKGLGATIFGYGDVEVRFDGADKPIVIKSVIDPELVKEKLLKIREFVESNDENNPGSIAKKLLELVEQMNSGQKVPVRIESKKTEENGS